MLHLLPAEIALQTVACLPIQSLQTISQVSRAWHDLLAVNENTVYLNAAIYHKFVSEEDIRLRSLSQILGGNDWKSFCRRELQIQKAWRGRAPSHVNEISACGSSVHRIKVDEENNLLITTSQTGGIVVTDINDNHVLWGLPPSFVVDYAHCEYARGYIVVNRLDNCKEVWRRVVDTRDDEHSMVSPPDAHMLRAWTDVTAQWSTSTRHGHFRAWALLRMPEMTRAFRFSYPTLLVAGEDNAYIWNVPEGRLVETIRDIQKSRHDDRLGIINYVEVDDKYAFICGSNQFRIFERGGGALVFQLSPKDLLPKAWHVLSSGDDHATAYSIVKPQKLQLSPLKVNTNMLTKFKAVHISSDGRVLAILASCGVLVLIPDFPRLVSGGAQLSDIAIQINLCPTLEDDRDLGIYLAMSESNGKVAVATRRAIYLISPHMDMGRFTADPSSRPGVVVSRLAKFDDRHFLSFISCLQITPTSIYFNWKPSRQNDPPNWANGNHFPMFIGGLLGHAHVNVVHGHTHIHFPPNHDQQANDQQPNNHAVGHDHNHDDEGDGSNIEVDNVDGSGDNVPHLEPATSEPGDSDEHEEDDDFFEDEDEEEFIDDFFDPDPDILGHPMEDPVMNHGPALHLHINEFFLPLNMSTAWRVSF
ncbi:hypothetical protein V8B97DRAFT_2024543 [Scleroderma yunnanense]